MPKLEPPDTHALTAALGWLELGNPAEALAELTSISAANQTHPGVLEVRWMILAQLNQWEPALAAATELMRVAPGNASGWLHHAYCLRRIPGGGLDQAWTALLPAAEMFPKEPVIAFNLACYACQLHRLDEARKWLQRARKIGESKEINAMALADPDLEPLWPEIRSHSEP